MGATSTAVARARAHGGVFAAIASVVLVLALLGTAVVDALAGSSIGGLRSGLAAATGVDGAARWQIRMSADPVEQADAAASVLDRMLAPNGAAWARSVQTTPVEAVVDGRPVDVVLLADPGIPGRATLGGGTWPDDPAAVAMAERADPDGIATTVQASAAEALGLGIGDVVELGGPDPERLVVVGTWAPDDASEPAWFGEPIVAAGLLDDAAGPFVVADDGDLADVPAAVVVRWTATVDAAAATPALVAGLRAALPNVEPALRAADGIGTDGLTSSGGLVSTLDRLLAGLTTVRAIAPLPVLLLAFAGFAAIDRLAALLAAARRGETVLLRARGASALRLLVGTVGEVAVVSVPAALAGVAIAWAVLGAVVPGTSRSPLTAATVGLACVLGAIVLVGGRAWWEATRPLLRGSGDEVGRMPRAAVAGGVLFVAVAAALTLWQFRLYGSPLVPNASGALEVDPVAVLAPVLVLVALALVGNALMRPVAHALERLAERRPGLVPSLPMRQLARRAGLYASASLVTVLAVGGLTLTAAFAGSWQTFDRAAAAAELGGDVRVAFAGRSVVGGPDPLALDDPFAGVAGVDASLPVFRGEARIGSDPATLVAIPVDEATKAGMVPAGAADVLAHESGSSGVPSGTSKIEVPVTVSASAGVPGEVAVSAWVLGPAGDASRLPAGTFEVASGGGEGVVALPAVEGLRLLGFDATLTGSRGLGEVEVGFGAVSFDGTTSEPDVEAHDRVHLSAKRPTGRTAVGGEAGAEPVPVMLGAALASRLGAATGDSIAFRVVTGGADVRATVAGIIPAIPGAGDSGMLTDLGALSEAAFLADAGVPASTERWIATADPTGVADDIRDGRTTALVATTQADVSSAPLIGPAVAALWAGAGGALLFAAVALAALTAALARTRFGEVVVLRALGMPSALQARARFAELATAVCTAVAVGAIVGAVASVATVRELARAGVAGAPAMLSVDLGLDVVPWAIGLLAFCAVAAAVGLVAAASVRRLAATPGIREEER
ncbi:FtsX-like permease family protein [Agromyces sp. CF514]|uniref:hypothetical protein n=1 Tax=Agromyces sp. CF514 TaxID=1881031 RepID=UPI0008F111DE|nr:hypothetical protein [Agromyces sp. CF514]SFR72549.1 FtsX-like permease family protein [Agromyces sp. CF514]